MSNHGSISKIWRKTTTSKFWIQKFEGKTTTYLQILNSNTIKNFLSGFFINTILNFAQECELYLCWHSKLVGKCFFWMYRRNIWMVTCPKMGLVGKVKSAFSLKKKHQNLVWSWKGEPTKVYPPSFLDRMTNLYLLCFSFIAFIYIT